jgi:hypothetical protein
MAPLATEEAGSGHADASSLSALQKQVAEEEKKLDFADDLMGAYA